MKISMMLIIQQKVKRIRQIFQRRAMTNAERSRMRRLNRLTGLRVSVLSPPIIHIIKCNQWAYNASQTTTSQFYKSACAYILFPRNDPVPHLLAPQETSSSVGVLMVVVVATAADLPTSHRFYYFFF